MRFFLGVIILTGCTLAAPIGVNTTPSGASFAGTCAGLWVSGSSFPGTAEQVDGFAGKTCMHNTSSVGGWAIAAATETGLVGNQAYSGDADSMATLGTLKLRTQGSGSAATPFAGGSANAGWNDTVTLTGGVNGTQATWMAPLHVDGTMTAVGVGAYARFQIAAYKADQLLAQTPLFLSASNPIRNGTIQYSWDKQMVAWGVSDYGPGNVLTLQSLSVDRVVWFAIPFTWGTPMEVAFYANAISGQISNGGTAVQNSSEVAFQNTVTWAGKGYVVPAGGGTVTDFQVAAGSGFDYNTAAVPEPSTGVLLGGALLLVATQRFKSQRKRGE